MKYHLSKGWIWICAAFVAGFCGSCLERAIRVNSVMADSSRTVRSNRFELIDSTGQPAAILETRTGRGSRLVFIDSKIGIPLEVGMSSTGKSFLRMNGADGKPRVTLRIVDGDKPLLTMGDGQWEQRVLLGTVQPDSPDPKSDSWALLFGNPIDRQLLAAIGMNTGSALRAARGSVSVRTGEGNRWEAPVASAKTQNELRQ